MSPGSSTESYPAFAHIGLRENPGKNLNQVTCPDRESNPGHLVSRPDALTVTPQVWTLLMLMALHNDAVLSPVSGHTTPTQADGLFTDMRLVSLEKQLNIELKVKQGAENMIQSLTSGHSRDKKLLQEAQQMLADSRVKIEFLKLRILKIRQNKQLRQQQGASSGDAPSNGDTHQAKDKYEPNLEPPLEERVEELRHRLRIEAAVVEGAKNVIRLLQSSKVADKKALQEVSTHPFQLALP
ncbi:hypothetical protein ANN_21610 [Periplaneta americana]|uniref:REM-1 domain-containing protein n=1 Tax=Periplaneta americana TaxID=6978 RepID=A0ABQ8S6J5_PERAM|nr:hypothetical protein ANN_21610 [Periplaneta americana]